MDNKAAQLKRLERIAEMMENFCDDPSTLRELSKEYKAISKGLFPKEKSEHQYSPKQIKESRENALSEIKDILDKGDVQNQFGNRSGRYHSNEKFIVSWKVNYNGFPHEVSIDLVDKFYSSYSGAKCIKARRSLFSEKQLEAYPSIEYALIKEGLKLCPNKKEKIEFFGKYAKPYNENIKR